MRAGAHMKHIGDYSETPPELLPRHQLSVDHFLSLHFTFFGPYTIQEKIGPAACKLDLHMSQLKPLVPDLHPVHFSVESGVTGFGT